jgi:hypothetical protein
MVCARNRAGQAVVVRGNVEDDDMLASLFSRSFLKNEALQ